MLMFPELVNKQNNFPAQEPTVRMRQSSCYKLIGCVVHLGKGGGIFLEPQLPDQVVARHLKCG